MGGGWAEGIGDCGAEAAEEGERRRVMVEKKKSMVRVLHNRVGVNEEDRGETGVLLMSSVVVSSGTKTPELEGKGK